jgi:hypothetical protein
MFVFVRNALLYLVEFGPDPWIVLVAMRVEASQS